MEHAAFIATSLSVLSLLAIATEVLGGRVGRLGVSAVLVACISAHAFAVGLENSIGLGLSSLLALTAGVAVAAATAAAVNHVTSEMFLLATIAAQLVLVSAIRNTPVVGGMVGMAVRANGATTIQVGFLAVVTCAAACIATQRIFDSHTVLAAAYETLAEDEIAARSAGLPMARLRWQAALFHGVLASLAGVLIALQFRYVAGEMFDVRLSLTVLTAMYVGGPQQPAYRQVYGASTVVALEEAIAWLLSGSTAVGPVQRVAVNVVLVSILAVHVFRRRRG